VSGLLLRGAVRVDAEGDEVPVDVRVEGRDVAAVGPAGALPAGGAAVVDATGLLLLPGLVDIQVHFREPGATEAEDIASGAAGAAAGGVTAVVMMPNTTPAIDAVDVVREVLDIGRRATVDVHTAAALTVGRRGEQPVDHAALHAAGVRIFTDDGDAVMDSALLRGALEASTRLPGMVVAQHAEDARLVAGGALTEGPVAEALGVRGRPAEAEEVVVARDLALARLTGGRYHVLHLSTARALDLVRRARAEGVRATCEVTPQHLVLTAEDVPRLGTSGKMNPPLRTDGDVAALRRGLAEGAVDAVATDHAPHAPERKALPLAEAPPGMLGVETAAAVVWTHLVGPGVLSRRRAVEVLSRTPARIAGLERHGGPVAAGRPANLCLLDPAARWVVDPAALASRSRNTPWAGDELVGRVVCTLVDGRVVHDPGGVAGR
jgi:dihydroorotase